MGNKKRNIVVLFFVCFVILCFPTVAKSGSTHCFGKCGVVDTGQTTVEVSGDDASYNPQGTQMSYTVSADSTTVTDNRTSLMWKRCSQGQDVDPSYGCTSTTTATQITWVNAITSCKDDRTAGYIDWRLPNVKELFTLVEFHAYGTTAPLGAPYINQTVFPNTVSNYYWTGTTYVPSTDVAMLVGFQYGPVDVILKTGSGYVRCVRGGP
ncbi:MAG: DUF1566 domain-containing protein [Elusimicrobiales bacterium]|nr:DUF1566 domain-containing protein [Elusimicrobiales bacterium]